MRVLIRESHKTVSIRIYGIDGDEHTREFFEKYFSDVIGVYATTEDERKEYSSDAEWTIESYENFRFFAQMVSVIQKSIDEVSKRLIEGADIEEYTFNEGCFVV